MSSFSLYTTKGVSGKSCEIRSSWKNHKKKELVASGIRDQSCGFMRNRDLSTSTTNVSSKPIKKALENELSSLHTKDSAELHNFKRQSAVSIARASEKRSSNSTKRIAEKRVLNYRRAEKLFW